MSIATPSRPNYRLDQSSSRHSQLRFRRSSILSNKNFFKAKKVWILPKHAISSDEPWKSKQYFLLFGAIVSFYVSTWSALSGSTNVFLYRRDMLSTTVRRILHFILKNSFWGTRPFEWRACKKYMDVRKRTSPECTVESLYTLWIGRNGTG